MNLCAVYWYMYWHWIKINELVNYLKEYSLEINIFDPIKIEVQPFMSFLTFSSEYTCKIWNHIYTKSVIKCLRLYVIIIILYWNYSRCDPNSSSVGLWECFILLADNLCHRSWIGSPSHTSWSLHQSHRCQRQYTSNATASVCHECHRECTRRGRCGAGPSVWWRRHSAAGTELQYGWPLAILQH